MVAGSGFAAVIVAGNWGRQKKGKGKGGGHAMRNASRRQGKRDEKK